MRQGIRGRCETPLGPVQLWLTPAGLAGLWFEDQAYAPDFSALGALSDHPQLRRLADWLGAYFDHAPAACCAKPPVPLDLSAGTPFQQGVWRALLTIPCGQTRSYGELARALGRPKAARAVGAAVGRNPISVLVPCHRVVGAGGALTGYAGGLARKADLLRREGC